jgi:hypothetical protein
MATEAWRLQTAATAPRERNAPAWRVNGPLAVLGLSALGRWFLLPPCFGWAWRMQSAATNRSHSRRLIHGWGLP